MLYKYVAQSPTGRDMGGSDFSDDGSEGSGFHACSIANSVASGVTEKVEAQFEGLQKLLSGLTGGMMAALVKNLQDLTELTEDESLTVKDLKRALVPFATSIQTVQSGVAAIETKLSEFGATNQEISSALLSFEGYIIAHAVFFKKIELRLSRVPVDDAEDQGDEFADEIRSLNEENEEGSITAYAEGLKAICLEVQDAIAHRLGLEPLSSAYVADPDALPLTIENLAAFSSGTVARSERSGGSSAGGGYKYREDFNTLRGEAHVEISAMLEILAATIDFPHGQNLGGLRKKLADTIQAQETKFDQFLARMGSATTSGEADSLVQEALANVGRDLGEEVRLYRSLRTNIEALKLPSGSEVASAEALKPIVSELSSFLMSPKDGEVTFDLARMTQQVETLLGLLTVSRQELPLRLSDLHDHLVLGKGLKDCKGERLDKKTLNKVHAFLETLKRTESLTHYQMIDSIRVQFETGFSGAATGGGTATPSGKRK